MYSIGEFSKIGNISRKTLRYYDEIGLLRPAWVDEANRYRYYAEDQVEAILMISELKGLGLRLEQIKAVMEQGDPSLLENFLGQRLRQIDYQVQDCLRLRRSIEKKMRAIESGGNNMVNDSTLSVETKVFEPVWAMSRKEIINIEDISKVIGRVFEGIFSNGLQPAGLVMVFYLDEEFDHDHAGIEVCIPVADGPDVRKIPGVKEVAPGLCATCTYTGVYSQLGRAYAAVLKWIEDNGWRISAAPFDCYMNDPQAVQSPEDLVTQVWFPIERI